MFTPLLLSSCILAEDDTSETVCQSIINTVKEKGKLLDNWIAVHEAKVGTDHDIPTSTQMRLSKLGKGGVVMSDNCNQARKVTKLLVDHITIVAEEKAVADGEDPNEEGNNVLVLIGNYHNHLRNTWMGALNKCLSQYLNQMLQCDLDDINFRYRVSTCFDAVLRAVDKEFSLPANYPKGHGVEFQHWLKDKHPGALLVPVENTAGSRQDMTTQGAAAVYWNRRYYVPFLIESGKSKMNENILQENLFTVFASTEMIALTRVFAIVHFSIVMPMRWLAGNTHHLGAQNWSVRSMGKAIDALHDALVELETDGSLFLNEIFMKGIFDSIINDVPELAEYCE